RGSDRAAYTAPESGTVPDSCAAVAAATPSRQRRPRRRRRQLRRRRGPPRRGLAAFCEYLIYYAALLACTWPALPGESPLAPTSRSDGVRVMLLADTHTCWAGGRATDGARIPDEPVFAPGPRLFIFILGDLFDEGKWADDFEFRHHLARFSAMFRVPDRHPPASGGRQPTSAFTTTMLRSTRWTASKPPSTCPLCSWCRLGGVNFVLANSVAFEGDGCFLCRRARVELAAVSNRLRCAFGIRLGDACSEESPRRRRSAAPATAPILLTHYRWPGSMRAPATPSLRLPKGAAAAPGDSREQSRDHRWRRLGARPLLSQQTRLRPRWDCLSAEASDTLAEAVRPRLAFVGHTALVLPAPPQPGRRFSWRNINSPSFLLLTVSGGAHSVAKCRMPRASPR
uniref:Metallophos domain-containing protein n=1 Tax=Macrostomum lignano TaxID=282301 RepID=A0A1I8FD40_9PLAT